MEIKKIQLNVELSQREIERIVQTLYTINEIENIEVDADNSIILIYLGSSISDEYLRRVFKSLGLNPEIKF